jgi:hypothetical protein
MRVPVKGCGCRGGAMTELEKLRRGQVWIVEALFQVAEDYDCMINNIRFIPTNEGQQLFFNLNGNRFRWILPGSEIKDCVEEGVPKNQILHSRAKIKQRFRELLIIHKRVIPLGER